ncbi:hypothetical protein [Lysinibacillus fusiformis]|uniref:hypothetical protein n=1 Tax=Lysinibacillus fusiformis TaxID=28031 RepID=UPI00046A22A1|nr:hypothetical protein [Lysinibacillus fusiformis]
MNKYKIISRNGNHENYFYGESILYSGSEYIFMIDNKVMLTLSQKYYYEPMLVVYDDLYKNKLDGGREDYEFL